MRFNCKAETYLVVSETLLRWHSALKNLCSVCQRFDTGAEVVGELELE